MKNDLLEIIRELIKDYKSYQGALELIEYANHRFELKIRDTMVNSIEGFTFGNFLTSSQIKTLAVIAYLQPEASRDQLYALRGKKSTVYKNIRDLKELQFIREKARKFSLTQNFYDYFQIRKMEPEIIKKKIQNFLK